MSLLEQLGQAVGGLLGGNNNQNPLLQALAGLLGQKSSVGGLAGLVQTFQKNGLDDIVNSWVSTGKNLPVPLSRFNRASAEIFSASWRPKPGSRPMPPARNSPVCYRTSWTS
jgi:uncharacterized protein YidB (DUF937 family)